MERNFSLDEIFDKFSDEILHKFVCELNKDIENKCRKNYSSDPSPNYIHIAKNSEKVQNTLQKNSINERELRNNLYSCARYAKTATDCESAVELYSGFGILTEELNEMLQWGADRYTGFIFIDLRKIKDVSDRNVIENLFEVFQSLLNNGKFKTGLYVLKLLIDLSRADFVSLIEIHRHVSKGRGRIRPHFGPF